MTNLSDIKKAHQGIYDYLKNLGFEDATDVVPMTSNPAMGDEAHDGKVSLHLAGKDQSGFLVVGTDDSLTFQPDANSDAQFVSGIHAPGISQWAAKIDPLYEQEGGVKGEWPASIAQAEKRQSGKALKGLVDASGIRPVGPFTNSTMKDFTELPIGHPAKDFIEKTLMRWGEEIKKDEKVSDPKKRNQAAAALYNKYCPTFQAMKSAKTFYGAGQSIWDNFPALHSKKDVTVLYPAAGSNVGALSLPMALIDEGAANVEVIFTEIDKEAPDEAAKMIEAWMKDNPSLTGSIVPKVEAGKNGGTRIHYDLNYKGQKMTLTYALSDSSKDLYFDAGDLKKADVVVVHDPYSDDYAVTETLFLKQVLPQLPKEGTPKAIVLANEADNQPDSLSPISKEAILPLKGWVIPDTFGHGGTYPIRNKKVGVTYWGPREVGQSVVRSALVISTGHPLIKLAAGNKENTDFLVDWAQMAGGADSFSGLDPGANPGEFNITREALKKLNMDIYSNPAILFKWISYHYKDVPQADKEFVLMVMARTFAMTVKDHDGDKNKMNSLIPSVSPDVIKDLANVLIKNKIVSPNEDLSAKLSKLNKQDFAKLDVVILAKQGQ